MSRDPNLAEGLPVIDAPFVAKDGRLVPADDSARLVNGGFEQSNNNTPTGWSFVDQPGKITFIDTAVKFEGRCSLRMQDIGLHDPQHGHGRACQTLTVKPFHYYHVSVAVKTQDFESAGDVHIAVLGKDGAALNYLQAARRKDAGLEADRRHLQQPGVLRGESLPGHLGRQARQDLVGRRADRAGRTGQRRPPRRRAAAGHQRRRQNRLSRGPRFRKTPAIPSSA